MGSKMYIVRDCTTLQNQGALPERNVEKVVEQEEVEQEEEEEYEEEQGKGQE